MCATGRGITGTAATKKKERCRKNREEQVRTSIRRPGHPVNSGWVAGSRDRMPDRSGRQKQSRWSRQPASKAGKPSAGVLWHPSDQAGPWRPHRPEAPCPWVGWTRSAHRASGSRQELKATKWNPRQRRIPQGEVPGRSSRQGSRRGQNASSGRSGRDYTHPTFRRAGVSGFGVRPKIFPCQPVGPARTGRPFRRRERHNHCMGRSRKNDS